MRIIVLIVCFAISETISARPKRSSGGIPIPIEDAGYFVSIRTSRRYQCCGALVFWNRVLTAASCVVDASYKLYPDFFVRSGTNKKYTKGTRRAIINAIVHPRFMEDSNLYYDIAVLTLSAFVPMDSKHSPILFPGVPPLHLAEASLIAFGNALIEYDNVYLHQLPIIIWTPEQLTSIHARDDTEYSSVFNGLIRHDQSMDNSDTGAPLVYNNSIIGIASRLFDDTSRYFINIYECAGFISAALSSE